MQVNTGVFERTGYNSMGARLFYFALGICVCYGLGFTAVLAKHFATLQLSPVLFIIVGLVIPFAGIFLAIKSDSAFLSFVGYNMVCIPFGVILGPFVNQYSPELVHKAFLLTMEITAVMALSGVLFPQVYRNIGGALFMALAGLLIVRIAQLFIPELREFGIIDWIAAGIFSLYIGYDMHRATEVPKTLNNAVDISVDLYLDILNLFVNILKIMGSSSDSD